ncbi:hypothetical protein J6590_090568, partial [Homalodisca vitripennis]
MFAQKAVALRCILPTPKPTGTEKGQWPTIVLPPFYCSHPVSTHPRHLVQKGEDAKLEERGQMNGFFRCVYEKREKKPCWKGGRMHLFTHVNAKLLRNVFVQSMSEGSTTDVARRVCLGLHPRRNSFCPLFCARGEMLAARPISCRRNLFHTGTKTSISPATSDAPVSSIAFQVFGKCGRLDEYSWRGVSPPQFLFGQNVHLMSELLLVMVLRP